jgi:hypothetical protein
VNRQSGNRMIDTFLTFKEFSKMNISKMNKSELAALVAQLTASVPDDVAPKNDAPDSVSVSYIANGQEQAITFKAQAITSDDISGIIKGRNISDAYLFALFTGAPLPMTASEFSKALKAQHDADHAHLPKEERPPFNRDVYPAYQLVKKADAIRKLHNGELTEIWADFIETKKAEYAEKVKIAKAEDKKIDALRIQSPSINGLYKIVSAMYRTVTEESAIEKAVKFLQKAIDAMDSTEKLTKAESQFHSKLIAALADPEAKKYQG